MTHTDKEALKLALAKIKSARCCHPNAVQELIFEAEEILEQALSAPTVQEPVEFGMHGKKMMFKVGAQQFTLDYEPDTQEEVDFMREMLIHAFSTFTHGVKTTPPAQPALVPLTDEALEAVIGDWSCLSWGDRIGEVLCIARAIEQAHGITKDKP